METKQEISYSQFINKLENNEFREIVEKDTEILAKVEENNKNIVYTTRKVTGRIGTTLKLWRR